MVVKLLVVMAQIQIKKRANQATAFALVGFQKRKRLVLLSKDKRGSFTNKMNRTDPIFEHQTRNNNN